MALFLREVNKLTVKKNLKTHKLNIINILKIYYGSVWFSLEKKL